MNTIGNKTRKVACVATLTAAGLTFGLTPGASATPQKAPKSPSARSDQTPDPDQSKPDEEKS